MDVQAAPDGIGVAGRVDATRYMAGRLFAGVAPDELGTMLGCLDVRERSFDRGEFVVHRGDAVRFVGYVLAGQLTLERGDVLGNRSILGTLRSGDTFAEAYAAAGKPSGVDVVAAAPCEVALIDIDRILGTCSNACAFHARLVRNLFAAMAQRNVALTRKIADITPRTIRGRLTSYLAEQARTADEQGIFRIPYTRQQLADYLCVDRSALSTELSKMRAEGLIDVDGASFRLHV